MWVIVLIEVKPNTPIFEIREKVYKYRYKEPFESQVNAVSTIISRNIIGKTLTEKINELRAESAVRDDLCQFDMLIDIIGNAAGKEGNPLNIEPFFDTFVELCGIMESHRSYCKGRNSLLIYL